MKNDRGYCKVLHRFMLVVSMVKLVMGGVGKNTRTVHAEPLSVTADYPEGCNGGPGPAKHGDSTRVRKGACKYNMEGYNSHGVHQESTGIIVESNMPGRNGDLKLQFNTLADGPGCTSIEVVSLNISGTLNLDAEEEGVYTRWNPGGRDIDYEERFEGISNIEIPSRVYVCLPNGEKASNGKYNVRGWANTGQLILHSDASATSHSGKVRLFTAQSVQVTKEWFKEKEEWIVGWRYQIYQRVKGNFDGTGPFESFESIATGVLIR